MKRCYSVEEVKKANEEMLLVLAEKGILDADDAGAQIQMFNEVYDKFIGKYDVQIMMVFTEDHEREDEEFGLALIETGYNECEWKMVYMAGNNGQIVLIVEE